MDYCATGGAESKVSYFGSGMGIASFARFSQWGGTLMKDFGSKCYKIDAVK